MERTDDLSFQSRTFNTYFYIVDGYKLLSPPHIIEKTIEEESYEIVDVEEANPEESSRISRYRGFRR